MKFYKNLYVGDTVKKPGKAIKKLKRHKLQPGLYVIACDGDTGQLAIYHSQLLFARARLWGFMRWGGGSGPLSVLPRSVLSPGL